jgi:hypothetical protein
MTEANIQKNKVTLLREFEKFFKKKYGLTIHDLDNPYINNKEDVYFNNDTED